MSRLRTIYNNEALLVGTTPSTSGTDNTGTIKRLHRIQTIGNSFEANLENINEYGQMAAIDRINLDGGTSSQEFSYYLTDFENEANLGFVISSTSSVIGNIANKTKADKNYYRFVAPEGLDAVNLPASSGAVMAVGNGYIGSYGLNVAVGSFPTATVSVQGLNTATYASGGGVSPAVNPADGTKTSGTFTLPTIAASSSTKPSVIKPGDVQVTFSNPNAGVFQTLDSSINVQKADIKFDFKLEPITKLGSRLAISREIKYPIDISLDIESLMSDLTANTGLVDFLCNSPTTDVTFKFYKTACDANGPSSDAANIFAQIVVKNAKISSQNFNGSIGPNNTVSMKFQSQVGAANDTVNGIFFSGVTGYTTGNVALKSS